MKLFAAWSLAFAALVLASQFKPWVHEHMVSSNPEDAIVVYGIFGAFFLIVSGFGVYAALMGRRILRLGQYPLPDAWVIHDTQVVAGPSATRRGYVVIVAGICAFLFSAALFLFFVLVAAKAWLAP